MSGLNHIMRTFWEVANRHESQELIVNKGQIGPDRVGSNRTPKNIGSEHTLLLLYLAFYTCLVQQ